MLLNIERKHSGLMVDVHILTEGFTSPNSRAFLFPIFRYQTAIRDAGVDVSIFTRESERLLECDTLLIDSKFHKTWWKGREEDIYNQLDTFSDAVDRVLWFDTTDSTGHLQTPVLEHVDGYYKNQLLEDTQQYTNPLYGQRLFTDYYHRTSGVTDADESSLTPVPERHLDKLHVSWNFGLTDYSVLMPVTYRLSSRLPNRLLPRIPWNRYFGSSRYWTDTGKSRSTDVSGRFGTSYDRNTVEHQRVRAEEILEDYSDTEFIRRLRYWQELKDSKLVVSPFGWGELCYRDFESFITGGVLIKPDMSHLRTWPPFYDDGETMLSVNWNLDDLGETIERALTDYETVREIAKNGQDRYRKYLVGDRARSLFVERFVNIVS
jgi:hypothetical protein